MMAELERDLAQSGVTDADINQDAKQGTERVPMLYQQHAHDLYARSTLAERAGDLDQARHLATEAARFEADAKMILKAKDYL
jgi:hypothetical protein